MRWLELCPVALDMLVSLFLPYRISLVAAWDRIEFALFLIFFVHPSLHWPICASDVKLGSSLPLSTFSWDNTHNATVIRVKIVSKSPQPMMQSRRWNLMSRTAFNSNSACYLINVGSHMTVQISALDRLQGRPLSQVRYFNWALNWWLPKRAWVNT